MNATLLLLTLGSPQIQVDLANEMTASRQYTESNIILSSMEYTVPRELRNKMTYLQALNYCGLNQKENAVKYSKKLLDSFEPLPRRYEAIAANILGNAGEWNLDDIGDISRNMRMSGDRLENGKIGKETQKLQKHIIDQLDKLIEEKEDKVAQAAKDAEDAKNGKIVKQRDLKPADDSRPMDDRGDGKTLEQKIKHYQDNWGTMPDKERARAIQELTRDLPPRYRLVIEEYFKSLNRKD